LKAHNFNGKDYVFDIRREALLTLKLDKSPAINNFNEPTFPTILYI